MTRLEIVLAAIGIAAIVSLAGVTLAYSNTLANQQQNQNLLLYYYYGIPTEYGIFFQVTNSTNSSNPEMIIKKITLSQFHTLNDSTFNWTNNAVLKTENGPSLYTILWTYFNLNITDVINTENATLNITVIGPESSLIYPGSIWTLNNISTDYPLLDYAEGGGGGAQLYLGTMKLCAPPYKVGKISPLNPNEQWIPWANWVKGVTYIAVTFSYPVT